MNIESTGLIFFSPTKTTKKIVEGIAQGLQPTSKQYFDLTPPDAATLKCQEFTQDLAIIGAPVYAGRLPTVFGAITFPMVEGKISIVSSLFIH
jgi:menaquinone-dependent protoporphyrinogen IX oxidase